MTAIPEDIIQAAREEFDQSVDAMCLTWDHSFGLMDEEQREGLRRCFRQIGVHHVVPAIARVAMAERIAEGVRCAAILKLMVEDIRKAIEVAIRSAVKTERELCALVIEDELVEIYEDSPDIDIECNNLCRRAATAIRSQTGGS